MGSVFGCTKIPENDDIAALVSVVGLEFLSFKVNRKEVARVPRQSRKRRAQEKLSHEKVRKEREKSGAFVVGAKK